MKRILLFASCVWLFVACATKDNDSSLQTLTNTSAPQDSLCEKTTIFLKNMIDQQQYVIDSLQRELNKRTTAQR